MSSSTQSSPTEPTSMSPIGETSNISFIDGREKSGDLDWSSLNEVLSVHKNCVSDLSDAYGRCSYGESSASELVLIVGPAGCGKTSLAHQLLRRVEADNGFMITGKFDFLESNLQEATTQVFSAFIEAFTVYIDLVSNSDASTIKSVKDALEIAMDPTELQALQDILPALEKIVDQRRPRRPSVTKTSTLKGADAEERLIEFLSLFVRTICSMRRPIVLFLDDLQWASRSALSFLTSLLLNVEDGSPPSTSSLMVLCTCRMNEVPDDHHLIAMLQDLREHRVTITEIPLSALTLADVNTIVSNLFGSSIDETITISEALLHATEGNLLFLIELCKALSEDEIVIHREDGKWTWNMDEVQTALQIGSIRRLIEKKYHRLESKAQELVRTASCLGSKVPVEALRYTGIAGADEINIHLQSLTKSGFIKFDVNSSTCRFVHDNVQQTIYQLSPDCILQELHLKIGRKLWELMPKELFHKHILLVSHQISLGVHLIYDEREKCETAKLFFQAGQKAALSSSFVTAATYLHLALRLLCRRHWRDQYKLSLQLYNFAAELEYYNGNLTRVDELVEAVFRHARSFDDTMISRFTKIYSLGSRDNMQEGLAESLNVLKCLGSKLPREPSLFHIVVGFMRCKQLLRRNSNEDILNLPTMRDKKKLTAMRLLAFSFTFALYVSEGHVPLIAFGLVQNAFRHGMSGTASTGFAMLGVVFGHIEEACRCSELAVKLMEKYDAREWQARLGGMVYGMVYPLKHPFRDCLQPLYASHRSSLVLGDIHYSMICHGSFLSVNYFAGSPLPSVLKEARRCRSLCIKYGQRSVQSSAEITLQFVLNLVGQSRNPLNLTGEGCNEDELLNASKTKNLVNFYYAHFLKLNLAVYMNDLAATKSLLQKLRKLDEKKILPFIVGLLHFFKGLGYTMSATTAGRNMARKHLAKLKVFAKNGPCNFMSKVHLIAAMLEAQAGKIDAAMTSFTLAIELARHEGLLNDQALACERAAYELQKYHRLEEARTYMANARALYLEWGAQAKVDQIDNLIAI